MRLHFVHGWALGPQMWEPLAGLLPQVRASFTDRGYFSPALHHWPDEPFTCVAHSLGVLLALESLPAHCMGLVSINGFDRFCADPAKARPGWAPRVLDRMLTRLAADPVSTLAEFRTKCGCSDPFVIADHAALARDLALLRDLDCRAQSAALPVPLLALDGMGDPIVSPEMQAAQFQQVASLARTCHRDGGHLLPVTDPRWCAEQIVAFVQTHAEP